MIPSPRHAEPDPPLEVIHRGRGYIAINKQSGVLSVPGKNPAVPNCVDLCRRTFPDATGPMVIHRLDMETSGLLLMALDEDTQRELSMQFEARMVDKKYIALLHALVDADAGRVSLPIRPDIERRPIQIVDHAHGKPSTTMFRVLSREVDRTRVEFEPITGRTHQLRVHAATPRAEGGMGHPIIGDVLYSPPPHAPRLMLHASFLAFMDPSTGRRVELESRPEF